jgi:hypothetical protein
MTRSLKKLLKVSQKLQMMLQTVRVVIIAYIHTRKAHVRTKTSRRSERPNAGRAARTAKFIAFALRI